MVIQYCGLPTYRIRNFFRWVNEYDIQYRNVKQLKALCRNPQWNDYDRVQMSKNYKTNRFTILQNLYEDFINCSTRRHPFQERRYRLSIDEKVCMLRLKDK